jgi:thioredoxin 1
MDELEELRRKKLEQLKEQFLKGEKKMGDNWPNEPININDGNLEEVVNRYDTVAVDCWAEWCAPCHMIAPILKELATEMQGKIVFGKLNVDENRNIAMKYSIMSIPTLLVFKNRELVDRIVGAMPKEMLKQQIVKYQ